MVHNYISGSAPGRSRSKVGIESLANVPGPAPHSEFDNRVSDLLEGLPRIGLSARELECVRLRTEDLSYQEIAAVLGLQAGTVGALLARAHGKIRKAVGIGTARALTSARHLYRTNAMHPSLATLLAYCDGESRRGPERPHRQVSGPVREVPPPAAGHPEREGRAIESRGFGSHPGRGRLQPSLRGPRASAPPDCNRIMRSTVSVAKLTLNPGALADGDSLGLARKRFIRFHETSRRAGSRTPHSGCGEHSGFGEQGSASRLPRHGSFATVTSYRRALRERQWTAARFGWSAVGNRGLAEKHGRRGSV